MNRSFPTNYALDLNKKVLTNVDAIDKQVISQSIESILMTDFGERVFEPNFGSFLSTIVFDRINEKSGESILDSIIEQILKFENRISIYTESFSLNISRSTHTMEIKIMYVINKTKTPGEFNKKIVF